MASGLDPQTSSDPAKAIQVLAGKPSLFALIGILAVLASGFGLVFTIGLWWRLREPAPTRAYAAFVLALVGLTGHALGALILWRGGATGVSAFSRDQVAARHAGSGGDAGEQGGEGPGGSVPGATL